MIWPPNAQDMALSHRGIDHHIRDALRSASAEQLWREIIFDEPGGRMQRIAREILIEREGLFRMLEDEKNNG